MRQYLRTTLRAGLAAAFVACAALAVAQTAPPAPAPIITNTARFLPVVARNGMVVAQEKRATHVGVEILKAGGNAIDAAVAVGFALAVTHPQAGNLGGGGFMLIWLAAQKKVLAIDYRETAPAAATRNMFLDPKGNVDRDKARYSRASSGVPGTVAGLLYAQEHYGTLPLDRILAPAIKLAEEGFPVSYGLAYALAKSHERFSHDPSSMVYFEHPNG